MAQICNTALWLSPEMQRDKKDLAQTAGLTLTAAASDMFKAIEMTERSENPGSSAVYIASAQERLSQVIDLLERVRTMLASKAPSPELSAWYGQLDYDRIYDEGIASGDLPASRELWHRAVAPLPAGGPVAACDAYLSWVRSATTALAGYLANPDAGKVTKLETAIVELSICARFGAHLNKLEPLDARWLRPAEAVTAAR